MDIPALPYCHTQIKAPRPPSPSYPKQINTLGDHLRKRRLELGLFQKQLAELIGVGETTVSNWEGQRSHPASFFMPAIIGFLGYNPLPEADTLAGKLIRYRVSYGLSQRALAKRLSIDPSTLARWERGDKNPAGLYRKLLENLLGGQP